MKILICCAGGFSSSIVEKKLREYGQKVGEEIDVRAVGTSEVSEIINDGYQVLLYAPQVRNRARDLQATADKAGIPCALLAPQDYALANAVNIYKQAKSLIG